MLPNKPAVELNKINKAAVPDAPFTEVQPRNTIKGDKNMKKARANASKSGNADRDG